MVHLFDPTIQEKIKSDLYEIEKLSYSFYQLILKIRQLDRARTDLGEECSKTTRAIKFYFQQIFSNFSNISPPDDSIPQRYLADSNQRMRPELKKKLTAGNIREVSRTKEHVRFNSSSTSRNIPAEIPLSHPRSNFGNEIGEALKNLDEKFQKNRFVGLILFQIPYVLLSSFSLR